MRPLFHPKTPRSGILHSRKTYFQLWKWWIGVGYQWLDCGNGGICPTTVRTNRVWYLDIGYVTLSVYRLPK
jgi:hypothetical protein